MYTVAVLDALYCYISFYDMVKSSQPVFICGNSSLIQKNNVEYRLHIDYKEKRYPIFDSFGQQIFFEQCIQASGTGVLSIAEPPNLVLLVIVSRSILHIFVYALVLFGLLV